MTSTNAPSTVDSLTLAERLREPGPRQPTVVDVRTPVEFESAHIAGSVNMPLEELLGSVDQVRRALAGHDVVLVCRSGQRAGRTQEALGRAGLTDSAVLHGGILDWQANGGDLARGRQAWELERQVRLAAGSLVLAGIAASAVAPRARWFSAFIGGGLVFAAVSNTCAMGMALARMPWNTRGARATGSALDRLTAGR